MRFNKTITSLKPDMINYENAPAFFQTPEQELYSLACTCIFSDQFYRSESAIFDRLKYLVSQTDPKFVMQLGVYAREQMYLRSLPVVLGTLLTRVNMPGLKKYITRVIQRVDEITEMLAVYEMINGSLKPIANAIKKGIALAFSNFDEYQFAKYKAQKKKITLRQALFLTHPKPTKEEAPVFKAIADNNLKIPYTWETELSKGGDKKETWEKLIESKKVGYMAILRNLRNIIQAKVSNECIDQIAAYIANEKTVLNSKQLPFRFLSAYRELQAMETEIVPQIIFDALEAAILVSTKNIKGFKGQRILIASDTSGSMWDHISTKSKIKRIDIGLILSMILQTQCHCISGIFGTGWKVVQFPKSNILQNVQSLSQIDVGWSTNGYKVIEWAIDNRQKFDKVFIFTDCQMWNSDLDDNQFHEYWSVYKKISPNARLYLFDLSGYETIPISQKRHDVFCIAGWSDKIFDALNAIENGSSIIQKIKEIEI